MRETECIQPFWASRGLETQQEEPEPLFMVGVLFVRDDFAYAETLEGLVHNLPLSHGFSAGG